jgi:hypothetical protein
MVLLGVADTQGNCQMSKKASSTADTREFNRDARFKALPLAAQYAISNHQCQIEEGHSAAVAFLTASSTLDKASTSVSQTVVEAAIRGMEEAQADIMATFGMSGQQVMTEILGGPVASTSQDKGKEKEVTKMTTSLPVSDAVTSALFNNRVSIAKELSSRAPCAPVPPDRLAEKKKRCDLSQQRLRKVGAPPPHPPPLPPPLKIVDSNAPFEAPPAYAVRQDEPNACLRGVVLRNNILQKVVAEFGYGTFEHTCTYRAPPEHDNRLVNNRNVNRVKEVHQIGRLQMGISMFKMWFLITMMGIGIFYSLLAELALFELVGFRAYLPFYLRSFLPRPDSLVFCAAAQFFIQFFQVIIWFVIAQWHNKINPQPQRLAKYVAFALSIVLCLKYMKFGVPLSVVTIIDFMHMFSCARFTKRVLFYSPHALSMVLGELRGSSTNDVTLRSNAYLHIRRLTACLPIKDLEHLTVIDGTVELCMTLIKIQEPDFIIGRPLEGSFVPFVAPT